MTLHFWWEVILLLWGYVALSTEQSWQMSVSGLRVQIDDLFGKSFKLVQQTCK